MNQKITSCLLALTICALSPLPLNAQDAPLPPLQDFERGLGLKFGDWALYNRFEAGLRSTTNIKQDPTEKSDYQPYFVGTAVAQSTWDRHALGFNITYYYEDALDDDEVNDDSLSGAINGQIDLDQNFHLTLGISRSDDIVSSEDPEAFSGNTTTTISDTANASIEWDGKSYFAALQGYYSEVESTSDTNSNGVAQITVQDRQEWNASILLGQKFDWGKFHIVAGPEIINYTGSAAVLPENRDSEGLRFGLGLEYVKDKFNADLSIEGFHQDFAADSIGKVTGFIGRLEASYSIDDDLSLAAKIQRSFDETNLTGSAGIYTNLATVAAQRKFNDNLYVKFGPSYRLVEFDGTSLETETFQFDATIGWNLINNVELLLVGSAFTQTVNDPSIIVYEYDEASLTFSTVITF
jgi:hypothetical protein